MVTKKTTTKKAPVKKTSAKTTKVKEPSHIGLVKNDAYLAPYEDAIRGRHEHALWKMNQLTQNGKLTLSDFANGHNYYGLHQTADGWVFREWAPNATEIYLVGDFNGWNEQEAYQCHRIEGTGNWELTLPHDAMQHGQYYKMRVHWEGGEGERIPAWTQRVVQDEASKIFSAQVWAPAEPYVWKKKDL